MRELKQATAANILVFMVDAADYVTGKTGLTLTITASKDGGAFASIGPTVTERGNGWYAVALTAGHTDTLGDLALHVTGAGAVPADFVSRVIAMDKTVANTPVNLIQIGGSASSASAIGAIGDYYSSNSKMPPGTGVVLLAGTSSVATATSLTLTGGAVGDDVYNGQWLVIQGGSGAGQCRLIIDYDGTTKVATIDTAWAQTPSGPALFAVLGARGQGVRAYDANGNAIPTGAANATSLLATVVDGARTVGDVLKRNLAAWSGLTERTNNDDGTTTIAFKAQDGTTTLFSVTFNPTTFVRTVAT